MTKTPAERLQEARRIKGYKTPNAAAEAFGWNVHTYKAHEAGARGIKPKVAEQYERAFGLAEGYILYGLNRKFDQKPTEMMGGLAGATYTGKVWDKNVKIPPTVPVYGPAAAGSDGVVRLTDDFIIGEDPRPPELMSVKDGFRMYVSGDSMQPRHFDGEKISVHPYQKPVIGQDCVIVMKEDGNALLKRYQGETATEVKVMQWNPEKHYTIKKSQIRAIYAVVR